MAGDLSFQLFEQELRPTEHSLATMRHALRAWLELSVIDEERRVDIVLAASELASAALRTLSSPGTTIVLRALLDQGDVVLECTSEQIAESDTSAFPTAWLTGDEGERAFSIIAALADVFAVKTSPGCVIGRARLHRTSLHATPR
jgi:anti-sigma regulatory factor (Ser/Thr protein kinase)